MSDTKHLSKIAYNHRRDFFLKHGPQLAEQYSKIYQIKYPEKYISSIPNNTDFTARDLFTYVENILSEHLDTEYKIHLDNDLFDNRLNFYSREVQLKMISEKEYLDSMYYFPFYPTNIPIQIRELLDENIEILEEYYKTCISSHLKQFYIRGHIKEFWLNTDYLYRYGFNKFINQFNRFNIITKKDIDSDLNKYTENGLYGLLRKADIYANYTNINEQKINVQLLKFRFKDSPTNEPICYNNYINKLNMNPLDYLINKSNLDEYVGASYEPINCVRELLNLPKLGEGWISETKLYYQLKNHFKSHTLLQHLKPKWLGRQHFDIYFPFLNIAVEYQGKQHFVPIEYFGGDESFKKNVERDNRKRKLAIENDCDLHYVESGYNIEELILNIKKSKNYQENSL